MKTHSYQAKINWTGNTGNGTKDYKSYERSHEAIIDNKTDILLSSDPSFRGDSSKHNPEELLVMSLASCHMLWYLHLCSVNKITVDEYEDSATGIMEEDKTGAGRFREVTLYPIVKIKESDKTDLAHSLHEKANKMCFIANSCNFPVQHDAKIEVV
ncbi:MAG: OsmC family protein [bacterium]|nr:OsmC family protein [bacterium]